MGKDIGKIIVSALCLIMLSNGFLPAQELTGKKYINVVGLGSIADSSFKGFTLDELSQFQGYYKSETERLLKEKDQLRKQGLQEMQTFIKGHPGSPILDKVIIRLANLRYEQIAHDFIVANDEYSKLVEQYNKGEIAALPEEPTKDYSRVLSLYQQIMTDFPDSKLVDDAIYLTGFIFEEMGHRQEAYDIFEDLVARNPEGGYIPDALMRMAESNFLPPVNDLQKAITLYQEVLKHKDSSKYDAALYRLGWVYYKLNDYAMAISYFTLLADDIKRFEGLDPEYKYHFPEVRDEGVQYIGISFMDYGGIELAARYFDEIGGRDYGFEVLSKIGDSYLEVKEEFASAIEAYELILGLYPDSPQAPEIEAKLARAYGKAENQRMAYASRSELFKKYRTDGEWWSKMDDPVAKKKARDLASGALRQNIQMLLAEAEEKKDPGLYQQAIDDSRDYLEAFPSDSQAVQIHWNMALIIDTKLNQQDQAFDEYVKISKTHWDSKFQKQAAANAVALADESVRKDAELSSGVETPLTATDTDSSSAKATAKLGDQDLSPQDLMPNELKLVDAINNYVTLFPHEPETARMLSKAGSIFYERNQFKDSIRYFKTLNKHFPNSEENAYAQYLTMESYFGKSDFESAEVLARGLKDRSPEYAAKANQRLSESMFLKAMSLADSSDHLAAADQFQRMALEVPNSEFADLALYNAATSLDQANEYEKAIQTYTRLLDNYPKSENAINALNNLAFDYRELGDYHNAAKTYERLSDEQEDSEASRVALYNASVSYVQSQEWLNTIRVNSKYVAQYPNSEDADDLLFNNAQYYLKLNDVTSANQIYKDFATNYPDSPRSVEASYQRGKYFLESNRFAEAKVEFDAAVALNSGLENAGKEANKHFAAEALYELAEIKFDEFRNIQFRLPAKALAESKIRKKALLSELTDSSTKIAAYGTIRLYKATYRIGEAYENFAKTWAGQDIAEADENKRIVAQNQNFASAAELYQHAVDAYKDGAKIIAKFSASDATAESSGESGKLAVDHTTKIEGQRWLTRSQDKISENLHAIAEMKFESVNKLVNAPTPAGLKRVEQLVYRNQILAKVVSPIVKEIIAAHTRNINEGAELELRNAWIESSRDRIVEVSNLVPNEFRKLSREALLGYQNELNPYKELIGKGDEAAFDVADRMANLIELSRSLSLAASSAFKENINLFTQVQVSDAKITGTEEDLMQAIFEQATLMNSLSSNADLQRKRYEELFKETEKLDYEDAFLNFDEKHFALADGATELLDLGFQAQQELVIENTWTQKINMALVQSNPDEYAASLGMEVMAEMISSSSDWMVSADYQRGWTETDFSDSHWSNAHDEGPSTELKGAGSKAIWLVNVDPTQIANMDSSGSLIEQVSITEGSVNQLASFIDRPDKVYFRNDFDIEGLPVSGIVQLNLDDSFALYVNGEFVADYRFDETGERKIHTFDISEHLKTGKNVLAIEATDLDDSRGSLEAALEIKNLPDWFKMKRELQKAEQDDHGN